MSALIVPGDWDTVIGSAQVDLSDAALRRVSVDLISEGAALFLLHAMNGDGEFSRSLVWAGRGSASIGVAVEGPAQLFVSQPEHGATAFRIPELRSLDAPWLRSPSLAELDPPKPFEVSPEIQAVVNKMNQNAIRREMLLLQALDARTKR